MLENKNALCGITVRSMKKHLFLVSCFLFFSISARSQTWYNDFETAKKISVATNRPMLVDFWAIWCKPCHMMDDEIWENEEVKDLLKNYVLVKINFDGNHDLSNQFEVQSIPYYFITDSNGTVIDKKLGYSGAREMNITKEKLKKFSVNLSYLQTPMAQYQHTKNYITALRLAEKYLDFSLFVDKQIKNEILDLSHYYLKEAENLLDKDQKNFKMIDQKIELTEAIIDLYNEKFSRVERFLSKKIDDTELTQNNEALFAYLNYCVSCKNSQAEEMNKWKHQLESYPNGKLYLSRAKNFLTSH